MMAIQRIPVYEPNADRHREQMATAINALIAGKADCVGTFTLTANATTTTLADNLLESNQVIVWMPTTANAAAAMANLYVSARSQGSFTLTHANTATVDRIFYYVRLG